MVKLDEINEMMFESSGSVGVGDDDELLFISSLGRCCSDKLIGKSLISSRSVPLTLPISSDSLVHHHLIRSTSSNLSLIDVNSLKSSKRNLTHLTNAVDSNPLLVDSHNPKTDPQCHLSDISFFDQDPDVSDESEVGVDVLKDCLCETLRKNQQLERLVDELKDQLKSNKNEMLDWQEKENIYQARIASLIETLRQSTDRPYTFTEPISFNDDESFNQSVSSSYERGDEEERYLTTPRTSSSISRNSENTSESVNNRPDDQVVVSGDDAGDPSETIDLAVLVSSYVETIESMEVTILDLNSELEDLNRAYQALISHQRFHQDNLTEATDRHYIDQNSLEGEEDYRGSVGSVSEETGRTSWAETIDKKSIVRRIKQFEMIEGGSGEFKEILNDEDHYNESIENQRVKSLMVEIYELRETNRKLNDYLSKILCRIIGLEAFEVVLNRDFDILKIKKSSSSSSNGKKKNSQK